MMKKLNCKGMVEKFVRTIALQSDLLSFGFGHCVMTFSNMQCYMFQNNVHMYMYIALKFEFEITKFRKLSSEIYTCFFMLSLHRDIRRHHHSRKWHNEKQLKRMVLFLKMESVWSRRGYHRFAKS